MMVGSGDAYDSLAALRVDSVYDFEIPGACVKKSDVAKTGVPNVLEFRVSYPIKITVAATSWTTPLAFDLTNFVDLPQHAPGTWIDVAGVVARAQDVRSPFVSETQASASSVSNPYFTEDAANS